MALCLAQSVQSQGEMVAMSFTLKTGDLAFYDSVRSGLVPIKLTSVKRDGSLFRVGVKVTAARHGFARGETFELGTSTFVIARGQVSVRRGFFYIGGTVTFEADKA